MTKTRSGCRRCGSTKPPGQGRKFCDACRPLARSEERERERARNRTRYQENPDAQDAASKQWADEHPERAAEIKRESYERELADGRRHNRNLAKFNLTPAQYEELLVAQGHVCAICGKASGKRRLNIDHDHQGGAVRGLLCSGCNGARLGRLGDSPNRAEARATMLERQAEHLRAAAAYLRQPPALNVLGEVKVS